MSVYDTYFGFVTLKRPQHLVLKCQKNSEAVSLLFEIGRIWKFCGFSNHSSVSNIASSMSKDKEIIRDVFLCANGDQKT